jgi:aspartate aminotransferase-like enzyme
MRQLGVVVAATIGPIKGKGFRVGHMGNVNQSDITSTIGGVEATLRHLNHVFSLGG